MMRVRIMDEAAAQDVFILLLGVNLTEDIYGSFTEGHVDHDGKWTWTYGNGLQCGGFPGNVFFPFPFPW